MLQLVDIPVGCSDFLRDALNVLPRSASGPTSLRSLMLQSPRTSLGLQQRTVAGAKPHCVYDETLVRQFQGNDLQQNARVIGADSEYSGWVAVWVEVNHNARIPQRMFRSTPVPRHV